MCLFSWLKGHGVCLLLACCQRERRWLGWSLFLFCTVLLHVYSNGINSSQTDTLAIGKHGSWHYVLEGSKFYTYVYFYNQIKRFFNRSWPVCLLYWSMAFLLHEFLHAGSIVVLLQRYLIFFFTSSIIFPYVHLCGNFFCYDLNPSPLL